MGSDAIPICVAILTIAGVLYQEVDGLRSEDGALFTELSTDKDTDEMTTSSRDCNADDIQSCFEKPEKMRLCCNKCPENDFIKPNCVALGAAKTAVQVATSKVKEVVSKLSGQAYCDIKDLYTKKVSGKCSVKFVEEPIPAEGQKHISKMCGAPDFSDPDCQCDAACREYFGTKDEILKADCADDDERCFCRDGKDFNIGKQKGEADCDKEGGCGDACLAQEVEKMYHRPVEDNGNCSFAAIAVAYKSARAKDKDFADVAFPTTDLPQIECYDAHCMREWAYRALEIGMHQWSAADMAAMPGNEQVLLQGVKCHWPKSWLTQDDSGGNPLCQTAEKDCLNSQEKAPGGPCMNAVFHAAGMTKFVADDAGKKGPEIMENNKPTSRYYYDDYAEPPFIRYREDMRTEFSNFAEEERSISKEEERRLGSAHFGGEPQLLALSVLLHRRIEIWELNQGKLQRKKDFEAKIEPRYNPADPDDEKKQMARTHRHAIRIWMHRDFSHYDALIY